MSTQKKEQQQKQLEEIAETHRNQYNRQFYRKVNDMRKNFKPRITQCRDKEGNIVSNKLGILEHWVEQFEELLNKEIEAEESPTPVPEEGNNEQHAEESPPTIEETKAAH